MIGQLDGKSIARALLCLTVSVLCSCAQLPKDYQREQTAHFTDTADTELGARSHRARDGRSERCRIVPFADGVDAFLARVALAQLAERSLDMQYFLWHEDLTGQVLLGFVLDAADRGVRVRLLLDDLDNQSLDEELYALDRHPNITVRLFNPFATRGFKYVDFFTDTSRVNRRMHNKSFTADNQFAILGGRNIGDEYFDAREDQNFYDYDALVSGPVVERVSEAFDLYWNHEMAVPVHAFDHNDATDADLDALRVRLKAFLEANRDSQYAVDLDKSELAAALRNPHHVELYDFFGDAQVIYDHPDKVLGKSPGESTSMGDLVWPRLRAAKREIVAISPYYVPGDRGVEAAIEFVEEGLDTVVITNSYGSTDSSVVHAGYSRYREPLLAGGVKIFELKPSSRRPRRKGSVAYDSAARLHTKIFVIDRETVFIGSLNLDPRSIDINTEIGVLFDSPELAKIMLSRLGTEGLEHVYRLELVRSPSESKGEFTTYTWNIEWIEQMDGETVHYTSEPEVGAWDSLKLFLLGFVPESQI